MKGKRVFIYIVAVMICVITLTGAVVQKTSFIEAGSLVLTLVSVYLLVIEIYQSRKINEADFIADLNTTFVTNPDYKKAYTFFESYDFEDQPDIGISNVDISNYLTFFETFQLLIENGTLSIEMLDDLFGYRFFIAVHNPYVQRRKLVRSPNNFRNLYKLEKTWTEHRKKNGMSIFHEEYSLKNVVPAEIYESIIKSK